MVRQIIMTICGTDWSNVLRELERWLGRRNFRLLIGLLIATGLASLILQIAAPDASWSLSLQTALVLIFVGSVVYIVGRRMSPETRRRMLIVTLPAMGAVGLGLIVPSLLRLFLGAALGWLLTAQILMRNTEKREYKLAIRAMRQKDYEKAIEMMSHLIKQEPEVPEHYQFRAQLYRLNRELKRARRDYEKIVALTPETGVGQNGLAELYLQMGDLAAAREWGQKAYERAPEDWVALYNLGMVAERQHDDSAAIDFLRRALEMTLPDGRYRLLTKLWLARAYFRQGSDEQAEDTLRELKKEKAGLHDWKIIMESDEAAATIRELLAVDVEQAEALINGKALSDVFAAA